MTTPTPPDPADRVKELEAELARVKTERDIYKAAAYEVYRPHNPIPDPTEEEIADALTGPRGQPLLEIVAEFERRVAQ